MEELLGFGPEPPKKKDIRWEKAHRRGSIKQQIERTKAIILSMTKKERENPYSIKSSQKKRIAAGSATTIQDVNSLMKQFEQTKQMIKGMNSGKLQRMFGKNFKF